MTKDDVLDIISDAGYCFFSTTEGTQPRVRPLAPYYNFENNKLLVSLVPGSRTKKQILENPLVELCFVDKRMSFCRLTGKAEICEEMSKKEIIWNNVPNLRQFFEGPEDPNLTLIEVSIDNVEAMSMELHEPAIIDF